MIVWLEYYWMSGTFIIRNITFRYYCLLVMFAVFGFTMSPAFYSFHLIDIVGRSPTLQDVIKSATNNIKELTLTGMLGLIIIYIFSTFGFMFFYEQFYDEEVHRDILSERGQSVCKNMLHCFLSTLNYGVRLGGGLGDIVADQPYEPHNVWYLRAVYDLLFFFLVVIILLSIIGGIIIDTFAQLRDEKADFEKDMRNVCFICSIDRNEFDRFGKGFENHIENDHNIFNYVYFKIYINSKPETEYNGTESMIGEDSSWFPLHKALILEKFKDKKKGGHIH